MLIQNSERSKLENDKLELLSHFHQIQIKKPSDIIIQQIKKLIQEGILKPGDKIPPERDLQNRFGVSRTHVREAIKKLEFYGILKIMPQSGTIVANIGVKAIEGLISNVLKLEKNDFRALIDFRRLLELEATRLTARFATNDDIKDLENLLYDFKAQTDMGKDGLEEDILFHLKIAEFCKNSVLQSVIALITPDIISLSIDLKTCSGGRYRMALKEHEAIYYAIKNKNPEEAVNAMDIHLERTLLKFEEKYQKKI